LRALRNVLLDLVWLDVAEVIAEHHPDVETQTPYDVPGLLGLV
jgi:hypothetical protein